MENKKFRIIYDKAQDGLEKTFQVKNGALRHKAGVKFRALPFDTKEKNIVKDFLGICGCFVRIICEVDIQEEFDTETIISQIEEKVNIEESEKEVFRDIIQNLYLSDGTLSVFNLKAMTYIKKERSNEEKVALFLYDVLMNDVLREKFLSLIEKQENNLLNRLIFEGMPSLKSKKYNLETYVNFVPYVQTTFLKDLTFLLSQCELDCKSLQRVLEYYYVFYVSQLALKLNQFHQGEREKVEPLYYTLSWEITSQDRDAYSKGFSYLKKNVEELFSHAVTLEMINHNNLGMRMDYIDLYKYLTENSSDETEQEIVNLIEYYKQNVQDVDWDAFHEEVRDKSGEKAFDQIRELFNLVVYQFHKSTRKAPHDKYKNWIIFFIQERFGKSRGRNGFNFNLTEEDIILFTQIIVGVAGGRIRLKHLFEEMEQRGLFFDRESKKKIIELYEKLNLIEKKSDSGDAQYVRANL